MIVIRLVLVSTCFLAPGEKANEESGTFEWNADGSIITLKGKRLKFLIKENQLIHLDTAGNQMTGPLAEHYVLKKVAD